MTQISDAKALALQAVSDSVKRLVHKGRFDEPKWTENFESVMVKLTLIELKYLEHLFGTLPKNEKVEPSIK